MARTLVIKNADFSANKVTTVTFASVPCTGIAFASDTITITDQQPVEVAYTVTPSDTTDSITWASSNTNVVTVSEGVLTVVGVGSCIITATCGSFSDTVTVTVAITADLNWYLSYYQQNAAAHVLFWASTAATFASAYGKGDQAGQYGIYNADDTTGNYPVIKLPGNTGRVKVSVTSASSYANDSTAKIFWAKDISAQWSSNPQMAYFDTVGTAYNITTETEKIITVPEGFNAFVFGVKFASSQSSLEAAKATIAASGFKIEFLPPAA